METAAPVARRKRKDVMAKPSITFLIAASVAILIGATWFFGFRRVPACAGDGKLMATVAQCRASGLDAGVCATAIETARAVALRAAPKAESSFACEVLYAECFAGPDGRYTPSPSFCLAPGATEPSEVRYLQYESDRLNRKRAKEVRID
jgi:uncharacterized protein YgiB involved in biofilm formation